jgi:aryl sulfotransferase
MPTPTRTRTYLSHHRDSRRWDAYSPRAGDVIISTASKSGTTWTQRILSLLVFGPGDLPDALPRLSPCLDQWFLGPLDEEVARIDAQTRRRFLKAHLPLDGLPFFPQVRYINVGRDPRDVFMSVWNHYGEYTDAMIERLSQGPTGERFPRCPNDIHEYWQIWITTGAYPWETEGFPFGSPFAHAASFWPHRHLENVLLVHYAGMKTDLEGEIRRIAAFCNITIDEDMWPALVDAARFESMKRDAKKLAPGAERAFKGGAESFIYKGTSGRWRNALSAEELDLYERCIARLDAGLRAWLENGRLIAGDPRTL